jgi:hypothetical protein
VTYAEAKDMNDKGKEVVGVLTAVSGAMSAVGFLVALIPGGQVFGGIIMLIGVAVGLGAAAFDIWKQLSVPGAHGTFEAFLNHFNREAQVKFEGLTTEFTAPESTFHEATKNGQNPELKKLFDLVNDRELWGGAFRSNFFPCRLVEAPKLFDLGFRKQQIQDITETSDGNSGLISDILFAAGREPPF